MKKIVKRLLGLMMALVMILSTGLTSSKSLAIGNGKITVTNTTAGKTYSIYKIFDLTQNGDKVSYTIAKDWEDFFNTGAGKDYIVDKNNEGNSLGSITVNGKSKYINITEDNISDFAKAAMSVLESKTKAQTTTATDKTTTFENLDLGYYLVHPEGATDKANGQNSIVSLTSTTPDAEVVVKGVYPTVEKEVNKQTADIGEELQFTLKGKVPDTTGYSKYTFKMTDKLSDGLSFVSSANDVDVKIGNESITQNVTKSIDGQTLTVSFEMLNLQDKVGEPITITYKAKLNENAINKSENTNDVTLEYGRDGNTDETTDQVKVFTANVVVNKIDGKDTTPLEGAEFVLKNTDGKYYKVNENKEVSWVENINDATKLTTNKEGNVSFEGLAGGSYYLQETKAPEGYNLLTEDTFVEVVTGREGNKIIAISNEEVKVENYSGVTLPETGGKGTTLFTILGGAVILVALYSLAKGKLKKERK